MNKKNIKNNGFSLVELAIVTLILSLLTAAILSVKATTSQVEKFKTTQAKLNKIAKAIKVYKYSNSIRIPCPSTISLTPTHASFGVGSCNTSGIPATIDLTQNIRAGGVPVVDLALPAEYAFDAWGNKISYIMDGDLNAASSLAPTSTTLSNIVVSTAYVSGGASGTSALTKTVFANETDCTGAVITASVVTPPGPKAAAVCPAFILLSAGQNGYGAYQRGGVRKTSTFYYGKDEAENNIGTNALDITPPLTTGTTEAQDKYFVDKAQNYDQNDTTSTYFDDILVYYTLDELKN